MSTRRRTPSPRARRDVAPSEDLESTERPISVVVGDPHPLSLSGLARLVQESPRLRLLATARDDQEAVDRVGALAPDVAVLDLRMDGLGGHLVISEIHRLQLATRVLFIADASSGDLVLDALASGAAGCIDNDTSVEDIYRSIVRVAEGESVLGAGMGDELAEVLRVRGTSGFRLTPRELTILREIADGGTARVIAERMHLAVPTVKNHIQNLYAKLGVSDRGAAVAEGMRRGLVR